MLRCITIIFLASLFLFSCRSSESFTKRKYLPGFFHEKTTATKAKNSVSDESIPGITHEVIALQKQLRQETVNDKIVAEDETTAPVSVSTFSEESSSIQPRDTLQKTKREIRRERRKSDAYRSKASFTFGLESLISAILFTLVGLWLGGEGARRFTDEILLLIVLLLLIIPLYFALGVTSLIYAITSLFFAQKVRSKHPGEKAYEGEKATRMGIILSVIGLIALILGAILTLPHSMDW